MKGLFWKYILLIYILFIFPGKAIYSQTADSSIITIVFAGDVMAHIPNINAAYDSMTDSFHFQPCFKFIKPYLSSADLAVGNLETTFGGKPYMGYPLFSTPEDIAVALKDAGFKVLVTANNHCVDKGRNGLERTIQILDSLKIVHTGTFINKNVKDSVYPLVVNVKGSRLAILNYTYGTNSLPIPSPCMVNIIDTSKIRRDLIKAHKIADFAIVILHWGLEYERYPNYGQINLVKWLSRNGSDAIIGSHPHVVQTFQYIYPIKQDSTQVIPVIYSLGNFISNQRDRYKDGGIVFKLVLDKRDKVKVKECSYLPFWVYKGNLKGNYQYYLIPTNLYVNHHDYFQLTQQNDSTLLNFYGDTNELLKNLPEDKNFDLNLSE